jgi:hypothetical protein
MDPMRDIDEIVRRVKYAVPETGVEQLRVVHPADDDGIWYFSSPNVDGEIQIESPNGACPFLVETAELSSDSARKAESVDAAVEMIVDFLRGSER